jgi:hypothetical protein
VSARFSAKLLAVRREGSAIMSFWDPNLGEDSEPSDAISPRIVERHEMWVLGVPQCLKLNVRGWRFSRVQRSRQFEGRYFVFPEC